MAEVLEKTGKSVEEALQQALAELQLTADDVDYEVIEEASKGFLGFLGNKPAKIRVTVKEKAEAVENKAAEPKAKVADSAADEEKIEKAEAVNPADLEPVCLEKADKFLADVFAAMNIEVKLETKLTDEGYIIDLIGDDLGILIGKHGQTLDALQYLANLSVNHGRSEGRVHVILDVENYRERREETLIHLARRLADKAYRMGNEVRLEPMNRHERKIIHMALQDNHRVFTSSDGEEPYRYVVIKPQRSRRQYRRD